MERNVRRLLMAGGGALLVASVLAPTAGAAGRTGPEAVTATGAVATRTTAEAGTYIVQMAEPPAVAYEGGVPGLRATAPGRGRKIDPTSARVVDYVDHLRAAHTRALERAGGGRLLYDYTYGFNGFAARLSARGVATLSALDSVIAVTPDEERQLDTATTPAFLGLPDQGGLWEQLGGPAGTGKTGRGAGEDVIVGIVDGGIWPQHPSVSDRNAAGKRVYSQLPGWRGRCVPGELFVASDCNQKLIGARYYNAGWGGDAGIDAQLPWEFNSPRDYGGHGTHTATTAAGNYGVTPTGAAGAFGSVSGIAPRARIAAYKVCWETGGGGSCFSSDSVAAIDQAVADGVDVINFSISGSRTSFRDPVEVAFLFAADAGVFVAASAGNSGPTSGTVAHPGPWLTTVAAGTHNRGGNGSVTLGDGVTYEGASLATKVGPAPLVDATAVGLPGADPAALGLCYGAADGGATLDPAKVAGKIVVCDRGVIARTNKSLAVQDAGGVGMVLVNTSPSSVNADLHAVPTVHLRDGDRAAVKAYAAQAGATATINASTVTTTESAPFTASFSSRGPLAAGAGDLLKPDLIAPGQDILAGVAPPGNGGKLFDLYSGTSMSSPHVAGLAALLAQKHPAWSPMAIKSALMTSGYDVLDGGSPAPNTNPVLIFRQGAGHVRPNSAADPGLVFDAGWNDWLRFLCSAQPGGGCTGVAATDPSDYNSPSVSIGALAGSQSVTRTVTNVTSSSATYTPTVQMGGGVSATVTPASLTVAPGAKATFTITFTRTDAPLNAYSGGQLTLVEQGGPHRVRIPLLVRPVALAAPAEVSGTGSPVSYDVTFGYDGPFTASARGLVPASVAAGTVSADPDQTFSPSDPTGTVAIPMTVSAGTTHARFSLFDQDVAPGSDLDLYVYRSGALVGSSGNGGSDEQVDLRNPPAGDYTVYVHGWGIGAGTSAYRLHSWLVPGSSDGSMTATADATAVVGRTGRVDLAFSGLQPGTRYLGSVAYGGAAGMPAPTLVSVTTP